MKNSFRVLKISTALLALLSITACDPSMFFQEGDSYDGHYDHVSYPYDVYVEPIPEEVLKASYKGEVSSATVTKLESCTALKASMVAAWEAEIAEEDNPHCPECDHLYLNGYVEERKGSSMISEGSDLYFAHENDLHLIRVAGDASLTEVSTLDLGFFPAEIYLNKQQRTLSVFGDKLNSFGHLESFNVAVVDIETLSEPKVIRGFEFKKDVYRVVEASDGSLVVTGSTELTLPDELKNDEEFRAITAYLSDVRKMKELYDYAVTHTEGSPPQELLDLQQGAGVLVDVYESLFNARFDSVVADFNALLPAFSYRNGDEEPTLSPLSCNDIYTSEGGKDKNRFTQIVRLDTTGQGKHRRFALMGDSHVIIDVNENDMTLIGVTRKELEREEYYHVRDGVLNSEILNFDMNSDVPTFNYGSKLSGFIQSNTIRFDGDRIVLLSVQGLEPSSAYPEYFRNFGAINLFVLKITDTGYEKLGEHPHFAISDWLEGVSGMTWLGRDAMYLMNYYGNQEFYVNYSDVGNISSSANAVNHYPMTVGSVGDNRFVMLTEAHDEVSEDYSQSVRLVDVSSGVNLVASLSATNLSNFDLSYSTKVYETSEGFVFGFSDYYFPDNTDQIRGRLQVYRVDDNGLYKDGEIERPLGDFNTYVSCDAHRYGGMCLTAIPGPRTVPKISGVVNIDGKEYVATFAGEDISTNELGNLANEKRLDVSH